MCNVHFMRAVLKNISKKDKKEVSYMLKDALEDERKMQEVAVILDGMGYKKSADTIDLFRFDLWNYKISFPDRTGEGSELPTAWRESIRS